ncbi:MAG: 4-(cytidine 5'-diphospho)-2-C-methyl-D-erythritol kinase [Fusobacterium sp. JB021]|nr:4-(cytidine 5'-diphospho)-2-C-methyl-D-erythritol kinase [Fusobacterium sp. JB021]MDP0507187.1 4-(cytidine 5'-diphospho)-2-C-methyl-D-erythritol kinase [Fusobacterium sp. JB019]
MRKSIYSNAKINIGLNILAKKFNGYHKLDMLMVPISLADKLEINFKNIKGNLKINCDNKNIPTDEKNIIYKIYNKFYEVTQLEKEEVEIYLYKRIPSQAGLGGGSSNGAFFLKELNKYYKNILSEQNMIDISKEIGADIPFFIKNLPCRVEGIGEKLTEIKNNLEYKILLIKPDFGISTKRAYYLSDKLTDKKEANIEILIKSLKDNNLINLNLNNKNILEQSLLTEDENIINFRKKLDMLKNYNFFMSGSGSCYYSLLPKEESICIEELKKKVGDCDIYICNFL